MHLAGSTAPVGTALNPLQHTVVRLADAVLADDFGPATPLARLINDVRARQECRTGPAESD